MMIELGDRLRISRIGLELSQNKLASRTLIPASVISIYESGKRKPSIDNLIKLCKALGVSSDYIIGIDEDISMNNAICYNQIEKIKEILNNKEKDDE